MIPKIIHYCWFGRNPLPEDAKKYIEGWKKFCPDYQIVEWNEDTFDVESVPYVAEAYHSRKWAFVTDYVRLYALYHQGGIYMDTDVEVVKPLDCFLQEQAFSGFESETQVPTGIMASEKGNAVIKDLLDEYDGRRFILADGSLNMSTNVEYITDYFVQHGLRINDTKQTINGFTMYPHDYFCPKNSRTLEIVTTERTYTIHHFAGTWVGESTELRKKIKKLLGPKLCGIVVKIMDTLGIK